MSVRGGGLCECGPDLHFYSSILLSWLPLCLWLCTGSCLLQEVKQPKDLHLVLKELGEVLGAAISSKVPTAHGGVQW